MFMLVGIRVASKSPMFIISVRITHTKLLISLLNKAEKNLKQGITTKHKDIPRHEEGQIRKTDCILYRHTIQELQINYCSQHCLNT